MLDRMPGRGFNSRRVNPALLALLLVLTLALLAYVDHLTGRLLQLSLFYALLAGVAGWYRGRVAVVGVVLLSTFFTFASDRLTDDSVGLFYDIANHSLRAILWAILGFALVSLRKRIDLLDLAYEVIRIDLESGKKVQEAFLSRPLPQDQRVVVAVEFFTVRELGGDYFDVFIDGNKLLVLVADVSGKGAAAALVTSLFGGLFTEICLHHEDPADILTALDRAISPSLLEGMFVTAFLALIDLDSGLGFYASAGHDPQLVSSGQEFQELGPTGLPLGILDGFELVQRELQLLPGDTLILFTDGILNLKMHDGGRIEEHLSQMMFKQVGERPPDEIPKALFAKVNEHGTLDDDAVVLVISRTKS